MKSDAIFTHFSEGRINHAIGDATLESILPIESIERKFMYNEKRYEIEFFTFFLLKNIPNRHVNIEYERNKDINIVCVVSWLLKCFFRFFLKIICNLQCLRLFQGVKMEKWCFVLLMLLFFYFEENQ